MQDKIKEKKYMRERVKGKSMRKAAEASGVSLPTAFRTEKDPRFKSAMAAALDRAGANEDKIAKTVCEALDANKVISANIINQGGDGMADAHSQTKDFIDVPDHQVRIKAAELAGKFRGDFIERVQHSGSIDMNYADRLELARRRAQEKIKSAKS